MIKSLIRNYFINVFALWIAATNLGGFHVSDGLRSLLLVGGGFTLLHLFIKPILKLIAGPLNFLTLGLIGLIIDSAILFILTIYFPQISITPWIFPGLETNFLVLPPIELNLIASTVVSAFVINMVRSSLSLISSE